MKILLLGKNGQVGRELLQTLAPHYPVVAPDRGTADLEEPDSLVRTVRTAAADIIINAAGYTAVDRAETEPERAFRVNRDAVRTLATCARETGACLIHFSTDYVFDGRKGAPYVEDDAPNPLNVYGQSKLAGEEAVRASGCRHLVFRTSWVFASHGQNFVKTILKLAAERTDLQIVADQRGTPTGARLIADVARRAVERIEDGQGLEPSVTGTYHLCAAGATTWHEYAQHIVREAVRLGCEVAVGAEGILPIRTEDYPQAARRPQDARLDTRKLRSWLDMAMEPWQSEVTRVVADLTANRTDA